MFTFYGICSLGIMVTYITGVIMNKYTEWEEPTQLFKLFINITVQHLRRAT